MARILAKAPVPLPPKRPSGGGLRQDIGQPVDVSSTPDLEESAAAEVTPAARPISASRRVSAGQAPAEIEALILRHAERFALPASLVRRVAWRESSSIRTAQRPLLGLMQIRVQTARGLGFRGEPADLLDVDTNMTYAVAYLANAYKVAGRNETRAVALYAKGYYYEAKRKGMLQRADQDRIRRPITPAIAASAMSSVRLSVSRCG